MKCISNKPISEYPDLFGLWLVPSWDHRISSDSLKGSEDMQTTLNYDLVTQKKMGE